MAYEDEEDTEKVCPIWLRHDYSMKQSMKLCLETPISIKVFFNTGNL